MQLSRHIKSRTTRGIAGAIGRLIASGELPPEAQLPTVRALAKELEVSPSTVSLAWQVLIQAGLIETRRRGGTVVLRSPRPGPSHRYIQIHPAGSPQLDLSEGVADAALLPDLADALAHCSADVPSSTYFGPSILPELEEVLRQRWPFEPDEMTIVDGALDALDRLFAITVHIGARVIVENPTFPPILDLLELCGAEIVPVETDEHGLITAQVASALAEGEVTAVVLQPRAHNPSGHNMSADRAAQLAKILLKSTALVFEDDHADMITNGDPVSLGTYLPDRTVLVRSYSKSLSPDLRLAAVGGAGDIVQKLVQRRMLGPSWSSRLLQRVLLDLISDPTTVAAVQRANVESGRRRDAFVEALTARGVITHGTDGINVWVDVADERHAVEVLLTRGIAVAPGSLFTVAPLGQDHIRIACARLATNVDEVAEHIAQAARPPGRRRVV